MKTALFKGFIGQERWQKYFAEILAQQKMSHAYLFSGPQHLGKKTFVQFLVHSLVCVSPTTSGVPCSHCTSCHAWRGEAHPEFVQLSLKPESTSVGVEDVRGFRQALVSAPNLGRYRVGVLCNVDRVTPEGLSVLLKTIEEPAQSVVLLFVADRLQPLPATVQSRLQHCVFTPVKRDVLAAALQERGASHALAADLAALAAGRPGLALTWLADPQLRQTYVAEAQQLLALREQTLAKRFGFSETIAKVEDCSQRELLAKLSHWSLVLRDFLMTAANAPELTLHRQVLGTARQQVSGEHMRSALNAYQFLERAHQRLIQNANRRLALNTFFLTL